MSKLDYITIEVVENGYVVHEAGGDMYAPSYSRHRWAFETFRTLIDFLDSSLGEELPPKDDD